MDFSVIEGPAGETIHRRAPALLGGGAGRKSSRTGSERQGKAAKRARPLPSLHLPRLSRIAFQLSSCSLYFSASFE